MRNIFFGMLLIISVYACENKAKKEVKSAAGFISPNHIKQLEWLIGKWKNTSADGDLYEVWVKNNDSVFSGRSFMTGNGDTLFSETILLQNIGDDLFYKPIVSNQNTNQPVSFKLISNTNGEFVFENKTHDFPQRIIYKHPHPDSLYARIEGEQEKKFRMEEFSMTKVNE